MQTSEHFITHDTMTQIIEVKSMIKDIPTDIEGIVRIVQNILLHQHWAKQYGIELNEQKINEVYIRPIDDKLKVLSQKDIHTLLEPISYDKKLIGICRDFSVLISSLCREVGIPARARCGFADYFEEGKYIDHWICEVWNSQENRWMMVDAQLDEYQQSILEIDFNPLDISFPHFITGDHAWLLCRNNTYNPDVFGIFKWWGYDYLRCNLILDANSLVGMAMQPWDFWEGYKSLPIEEWTEDDFLKMDQLAKHMIHIDQDFDSFKKYIESNDKIKVPTDLSKVINGLF